MTNEKEVYRCSQKNRMTNARRNGTQKAKCMHFSSVFPCQASLQEFRSKISPFSAVFTDKIMKINKF